MKVAYLVTTFNGAKLVETIASIPKGSRLLVVDNSQTGWPLAKAWNYGIRRLCGEEGYDAVVCMNDDVVLREDTGELLADALLRRQYAERSQINSWAPGKLLVLISARHASPSDRCTEDVDRDLLARAKPQWQPGPDFSCFVTNLRLFEAMGGPIEEGFGLWHEDNDTHRRIQLAGFEAGAYAPYWHFRNGTTRTLSQTEVAMRFEQSKQHYIDRWGGYLGQETFLTPYGR